MGHEATARIHRARKQAQWQSKQVIGVERESSISIATYQGAEALQHLSGNGRRRDPTLSESRTEFRDRASVVAARVLLLQLHPQHVHHVRHPCHMCDYAATVACCERYVPACVRVEGFLELHVQCRRCEQES